MAPLIMIPVTLDYLGSGIFGLWMAVTAVTTMVAFADLGLGNGLMTRLVPCYSNGDSDRARRYISSAYVALFAMTGAAIVALWGISDLVSWGDAFNAGDSVSRSNSRNVSLICLAAFIINIPLSLVVRIQYAYQMVGRSNIWQAAGTLTSLALTIVAVQMRLPATTVVVAATIGPLAANILNSVWLFTRQMPELAPSLKHVDTSTARKLRQLSGSFFILTIATAVAGNADTIIIAHALGLESVTTYTVPAKLFASLGLLINVINLPLWPANGDAIAKGDYAWVSRITTRMTLASVATVAVTSMALLALSGNVLAGWLGESADEKNLMAGLAIWWILLAAISPRFMVQNAAGIIWPQLVGWTVYLILSAPAKFYIARQLGLAAVPYAGAILYAAVVVPSALYGYRISIAGDSKREPRELELH